MHAFKVFSLLALAGVSVALPRPAEVNNAVQERGFPGPGGPGGHGHPGGRPHFANFGGRPGGRPDHSDDSDDSNTVWEDVTVTATATVTYAGNFGGHRPTGAPSTGGGHAPSTPETTPAPSTGGSSSGGYMDIVSTWRSKLGLSALTHDSQLEANALKTAQDGHGQMKHQLIGKTMAQVLAPGSAGDFEHVFVGGWLCERPSMAGLNGICSSQSKGWSYGGQTGHADILVSKAYHSIGCAEAGGIWSCDLA